MKARCWSFVLGFLCIPAEVILSAWTVSQDPATTSNVRINSSLEIKCSSSNADVMGLYLRRLFQDKDIMFLSLKNERITKVVITPDFKGRINENQGLQQLGEAYWITFKLSLLKLEDSDLYYCKWTNNYFSHQSSNGTVVIVRESGPPERCPDSIIDIVLICLSILACIIILSIILLMIMRSRKFKKKFTPARHVKPVRPPRPARPVRPPRPDGPSCCCSPQLPQNHPYLVTSINSPNLRAVM